MACQTDEKRQRRIELCFFKFEEHQDLSFLDTDQLEIDLAFIGGERKNGKTQPYNNVNIRYLGSLDGHYECDDCGHEYDNTYDDYNERINILIKTLGGEDVLRDLISKYNAESAYIAFYMPVKTSEFIQEGYLSADTIKKLADLNLSVHFLFT